MIDDEVKTWNICVVLTTAQLRGFLGRVTRPRGTLRHFSAKKLYAEKNDYRLWVEKTDIGEITFSPEPLPVPGDKSFGFSMKRMVYEPAGSKGPAEQLQVVNDLGFDYGRYNECGWAHYRIIEGAPSHIQYISNSGFSSLAFTRQEDGSWKVEGEGTLNTFRNLKLDL